MAEYSSQSCFCRENDLRYTRVADANELVRFKQMHTSVKLCIQATDFSSAYHNIFLIYRQLFLMKTVMFVLLVAGLTVTLFATALQNVE